MDPLLAAFDAQLRTLDDGCLERVGRVIRHVSTGPDGWNGIEWSDVDSTTADAAIAEQVAYFASLGRRFEWKYYGYDRPADLPDRLRAAGLVPGVEEALMVAAVAHTPLDTPILEGVELRLVTTDEDLDLVRQVQDEVFGHSTTVVGPGAGTRAVVLAVAGDEPVSSSRVDFHEGTEFASLWGGGTRPAWRGRGVYRAMVGLRARLAAERGYRYLRTDALPTSRPILERLGFRRLTTTIPFTPPG